MRWAAAVSAVRYQPTRSGGQVRCLGRAARRDGRRRVGGERYGAGDRDLNAGSLVALRDSRDTLNRTRSRNLDAVRS